MGVSYKYFVTCIVAVFLALAIGILMGFMINGEGFLKDQSTKLLNQANQKMNKLNEVNSGLVSDNKKLTGIIDAYGKYAETINPYMVTDKLKGMKLAVIETTNDFMYYNTLSSLESAGADIISYITVKSSILNNNYKLEDRIKQFLSKRNIDFSGGVYKTFFGQIALAIINGNDRNIIDFAKRMDIINVNHYGTKRIDKVILAGGTISEEEAKAGIVDSAIIDRLKVSRIDVVGAENCNVTYSYINDYKKKGLSTVDNIDTPIGIISLTMVLEGREGNFGFKDSDSEVMPEGFVEDFNCGTK